MPLDNVSTSQGLRPTSIMEILLLNALKLGIDVTDELKYMSEKYAEDVNVTLLKAQLPVFKLMLYISGEFQSFHEIYSTFQSLDQCEKDLISEIVTVFKKSWSFQLLMQLVKDLFLPLVA